MPGLLLECKNRIKLTLVMKEDRFTISIDGNFLFESTDKTWSRGIFALTAWGPIRYYNLAISKAEKIAPWTPLAGKKTQRPKDLPIGELWKAFEFKGGGAGRSLRFGDLNNDGEMEVLSAQCIQRGGKDNMATISCITVYKLDGTLLWQQGNPDSRHGMITADLPIQIHDINNDGRLEVIICRDFHIQILDGLTGAILLENRLPEAPLESRHGSPDNVFSHLSGDSLFVIPASNINNSFSILVKNRYGRVWLLDSNLNLQWTQSTKTGHAPCFGNFLSNNSPDILVGSTLYSHEGKELWLVPTKDHVDTSCLVRMDKEKEPIALLACSDDGLIVTNTNGDILKRDLLGHTQDFCVGKFRDDLPGLQFWTKTFWGHPGILFLFSSDLNREMIIQTYPLGTQVYPIQWGQGPLEHILMSTHPEFGGLMDGWGNVIKVLPDDNHPWLCCDAIDIDNDGIDEIVCWDLDRFFVYKQDINSKGKVDKEKSQWRENESNYKTHFSPTAKLMQSP